MHMLEGGLQGGLLVGGAWSAELGFNVFAVVLHHTSLGTWGGYFF